MTAVQPLVTLAFHRTGSPPASELDVPALASLLRLDPHGHAVTIEHGQIALQFSGNAKPNLRGRSLHLRPFETMDGQITWLCGNHHVSAGLYPLGFLAGTNRPAKLETTIEPRFLPLECR
jgi:hypothetical protein